MECLPSIPMVIIKVQAPKLIGRSPLWPRTSQIIPRLLVRIGYKVRQSNDLVRLTAFIGRMVASTITTAITLSFRPTLSRGVSSSTKGMELFSHTILPTLSSRRPSKITLIILILSLSCLVLWRWTTHYPLVTVLSHFTKLLGVARLATLGTPQS